MCFILGFLNIVVSFYRTYAEDRKIADVLDLIVATLKIIVWPFFWVLAFIPVMGFRILPAKVRSRSRYSLRCSSKYMQRITQKMHIPHTIRLRPLFRPISEDNRIVALQELPRTISDNDNAAKLAHFLCYDILTLIASRTHFSDLISLSLTSRRIRETTFPNSELSARFKRFRTITCDRGTKSQCSICNIPICAVG